MIIFQPRPDERYRDFLDTTDSSTKIINKTIKFLNKLNDINKNFCSYTNNQF